MKVLILQGSPRRGGNTETVCRWMAEAITDAAGDVEVAALRLADLDIGGCTECFACQKVDDAPGCAVRDDMQTVYQQVLGADVLVMATPVFCWGPTSQLKAAQDRFYALCKFSVNEGGAFRSLVEGKRAALVVTAGGGPYDGAEICVAGFRTMADFVRMRRCGELVSAPVGDPASVAADAALAERARAFGRRLVS